MAKSSECLGHFWGVDAHGSPLYSPAWFDEVGSSPKRIRPVVGVASLSSSPTADRLRPTVRPTRRLSAGPALGAPGSGCPRRVGARGNRTTGAYGREGGAGAGNGGVSTSLFVLRMDLTTRIRRTSVPRSSRSRRIEAADADSVPRVNRTTDRRHSRTLQSHGDQLLLVF